MTIWTFGKVSRNHNTSVNGLEPIDVSGKPDLTNSESMAMKMFIHISDAVLIVTIHILRVADKLFDIVLQIHWSFKKKYINHPIIV